MKGRLFKLGDLFLGEEKEGNTEGDGNKRQETK